MKLLLTTLFLILPICADPLTSSWLTDLSGRYARLYEDNAAMGTNSSVTTWSRGQGTQAQPTYAGINEVAQDAAYIYIRTSGLPFHIMGPWYGETGNLFPNYPANVAATFRFTKTPSIPSNLNAPNNPIARVETGGGAIGYFIDGVAMFDSRDAFSYSTGDGEDGGPQNPSIGDDVWLRDAYVNEGATFDNAFAHQAGPNHHYHANAPGLRHLVGDSVNYDFPSNTYSEAPNGTHSPILGWCRDGIPIYGPYAYSDPTDSTSIIRRMISGYQKRDGTNGSTDLTIATGNGPHPNNQNTGRTTLPAWSSRNTHNPINNLNQYGPPVSPAYPIGHYLQDYAYKGDLTGLEFYGGIISDGAHNPAIHYDLNEYNVRFGVTPEYPNGTWAYFMNIESDGTPAFPYNIGRYFFGDVSANVNQDRAAIPLGATTIWEGGPEKELEICNIAVDDSNGNVTLIWNSVEGGNYSIEHSGILDNDWDPIAQAVGTDATTPLIDTGRATTDDKHFYRVGLDYISPFDDTGFVYDSSIVSVGAQNNILLLILDDWGLDASELYNTRTGAGIQLANMPNLKSLLFTDPNATPSDTPDKGLLFTRGYAQPICSPTRATILTGRQPYQHNVGNPQANATLPASELTFPEILATEAPDYGLASFGKWHLGSGDTGPFDTGGWPNFSGTLSGGVQDYTIWERVKIENGILVDSGTAIADLVTNGTYSSPYATSVQVDEAVSFINGQGTDPWMVWMGFNAPHDPFQDPAPYVTPAAGYSTTGTANKDNYVKMLEALDHEIGRLLNSVDLSKTNIIVVGDNGSPGQVDQAPAGGIANSKGSLNEGGIHVPFFATGPDIIINGKTDKIAHVVDLFSTILDLTNVNVSAATNGIDLHSTSLFPIFQGNDMEDRCLIAEKFGLNAALDGRALIDDDWPQYKLISIQDVTDPNDTSVYEFYEVGSEGVEISQFATLPPPAGDALDAYNFLVAKDQSLVPATLVPPVTIDIHLPTGGTPALPSLLNISNGNIVRPNGITIGGVAATWDAGDITVNGITTSAARVDNIGNPDPTSVVAEFDVANSGLTSGVTYSIIVSFPGANGNRVFTATTTYTVP